MDLLRGMAELIADFVMEAEVIARLGAGLYERTPERTMYRKWIPRAAMGRAPGDAGVESSEVARGRLAELERTVAWA